MEEQKKSKLDYVPSKKMDGKYAILMETSDEFQESWYSFIRYDDNEENLQHLQKQLHEIKWYIIEGMSTFDLVLDRLVSAQTAKEMSKVDLNSQSFHRKFDGVLKKIDFKFKKKNGNTTKMGKVCDLIGNGGIEDFIDDEDIDEEDLVTDEEIGDDNDDGEDDDDDDDDDESESEKEDVEETDETELTKKKIVGKLPPSLSRK